MEQIRMYPKARASSLDDPTEWTITEDGWSFGVGDRLFNYYDCEWIVVASDPLEGHLGWFKTTLDSGGAGPSLNSVRVSKEPPAWASST